MHYSHTGGNCIVQYTLYTIQCELQPVHYTQDTVQYKFCILAEQEGRLFNELHHKSHNTKHPGHFLEYSILSKTLQCI